MQPTKNPPGGFSFRRLDLVLLLGLLIGEGQSRIPPSAQFNALLKEKVVFAVRGGSDEEPSSSDDSKTWPIGSLFRMNNALKVEVSQKDENGPVSAHNKGRGGAMAVLKERKLLTPFDTSNVAPLSSRLLQDDDSRQTTEQGESEVTVVKKLWWNSAWHQQFPTDTEPAETTDEEDQNDTKEADELRWIRDAYETESTTEEEEETEEEDSEDWEVEEADEVTPEISTTRDEAKADVLDVTASPAEDEEESLEVPPKLVKKADPALLPAEMKVVDSLEKESQAESPYMSSGYWRLIDNVFTAGIAASNPSLRLSRRLRVVRKRAAYMTGLHGVLSGKHRDEDLASDVEGDEEHMGVIRRRLAAIDRARGNLARTTEDDKANNGSERGMFGRRQKRHETDYDSRYAFILQTEEDRNDEEEEARRNRVKEIDESISQGQQRLQELVTEKDILQRRPNPLWNYNTELEDLDEARLQRSTLTANSTETESVAASRTFNFPPPDLVDDYLDMIFSSGRLTRLNHTDLWKNGVFEDADEDDDEWLSSKDTTDARRRKRKGKASGGSRWLRNGLGEKIGEAAETSAYRAVGGGVMAFLSRSISSMHGINVMRHSDIRLFTEQTPTLPPITAGMQIPGVTGGSSSYAQGAFEDALRRGARKSKKRRKRRDDSFIQRDAVVETLLSQCQIAAPLLKLFPIAWQRAMLSNIITLVTAIMGDFFEGLEFQILGHRLNFAFVPITEEDMMRHLGTAAGDVFSRRNANGFEAAVKATANDVAENLKFLDRWHERILGGDVLKTQLADLIARLVLTLVDETLSGARMDLWTTHAGGPRLIPGLEYRTHSEDVKTATINE